MKIAITGAEGLMGLHMRCYLRGKGDVETVTLNREAFQDDDRLTGVLRDADVVIHLAGKNRGEPEEVAAENIAIADRLVSFLKRVVGSPHLLFSSSTQVDRENLYGSSKRECSEKFQQWADSVSARFSNLILPHLFGEEGKPFYNSAVSTFCHQIAHDEVPEIHTDTELNLLHCQDAASLIFQLIEEEHSGEHRPQGRRISVSEMLEKVRSLASTYRNRLIPDLSDPFDLRLFNTFRSYLEPANRLVALELMQDERGSLFEAVKAKQGGQTFFSSTKPGVTRGNHFHTRKVERFLVVAGEATIRMRRLFSEEVLAFNVDGTHPTYVDMPTLYTHNITNTGEGELLTLFWANEIFDSENADTFYEEV